MTKGSRVTLINCAQASMLAKGYTATGVDDLCREAGVSKGAFYHQFASKEDVAIAALEQFFAEGAKKLLGIPLEGVAPEDWLLTFLDGVAVQGHEFWKDGCLIGSLATEMAGVSPKLQTEVARLFAKMAQALLPITEPFVASVPQQKLSAAALAEHFLVVVEGAIVMSRAHHDTAKINQAVARFADQLRWLKPNTTSPKRKPITKGKQR